MKAYEDLTFSDDFIFSKVMENQELCRELIELLLDIKVGKIVYLKSQHIIDKDPLGQRIRFDVYLKDSDKIFDIEMQTTNKHDLPMRARYYQSLMDIDNLEKGNNYTELKESYIIFICTFDPFHKGECKYIFTQREKIYNELELNDKSYKVFYNATAYEKSCNNKIKAFLRYLTTRKPNSEFTQKLDKEVSLAKRNQPWRKNYMTLAMKYDEWLEEGLSKGILQKALETAKKLITNGKLTTTEIAEITGLDKSEVEKLK